MLDIIQPSYDIMIPLPLLRTLILPVIERAGRVCYKSEERITPDSAGPFIERLVKQLHHESVIEHSMATVKFTCDRGISHEIVRHRLAAFSQESTRYCNYAKKGIQIIHPPGLTPLQMTRRELLFESMQEVYEAELSEGLTPQISRGVLPTALKTEIVLTCNFREWRHIFRMRNSPKAHPQMVELVKPLAYEFAGVIPEIFNDAALGVILAGEEVLDH